MQRLFKMFPILVLLIAGIIISGCLGGQDKNLVATVNGTKITRTDLDNEYKLEPFMTAILGRAGFSAEQRKKIIMLDLIDRTIVRQKAEEEDIKVTDEQIQTRYKLFRMGRTQEQLIKELEKSSINEQALLHYIKDQAIEENLFFKVIKPRKVTEQEAKDYYKKNRKKFPDMTYKEAKALIMPRLQQTKTAQARTEWFDEARRDSNIRLYGW
ncbi:MAG: SurA N-terminal domain-containing protein [Actinomycetota bacterium]